MTKRNFSGRADRANKISKENPRGFRGFTYGPAAPVKHVDPAALAPVDPPRACRDYTLYVNSEIAATRTPKPYSQWRRAMTNPPRPKPELSPAVRAHRSLPYADAASAKRFDETEKLYPRD